MELRLLRRDWRQMSRRAPSGLGPEGIVVNLLLLLVPYVPKPFGSSVPHRTPMTVLLLRNDWTTLLLLLPLHLHHAGRCALHALQRCRQTEPRPAQGGARGRGPSGVAVVCFEEQRTVPQRQETLHPYPWQAVRVWSHAVAPPLRPKIMMRNRYDLYECHWERTIQRSSVWLQTEEGEALQKGNAEDDDDCCGTFPLLLLLRTAARSEGRDPSPS